MEHKIKHSDLKYLAVKLPEDIEKLKWYGDFDRAERVIDMRLKKDIPEALRRRLELEKWILRRLPLQYTYTQEEALKQLQETFEGITEEELERLRDEGAAEWLFVKGQVRYKDDFVENLLKTRLDLRPRLKDPSRVEDRIQGGQLLDRTVSAMKEKGGMAYRIRIRTSLQVEKAAERAGELIRVYLPLPVESGQVKNFRLLGTSVEPAFVSPPDYPQRTVCMEAKLEPGREFWAEYVFENHTRYHRLEEDRINETEARKPEQAAGRAGMCQKEQAAGRAGVCQKEQAADSQTPYLAEQLPHIRFTPYLRALTEQVTAGEKKPLKKARKIYDYITTHVMYSFVRQYATIDNLPEYMASGLKGDCGIYALLFITMCRIAGVPARWQSGLYATPLDIGSHDWAQFYIEPYGWLYADCSFGGAAWREGRTERWNFYFGNLDPFRVPTCSQFQHEFLPPAAFLREDPYDSQSGEAEYEDQGLISGVDYRTKREIIEIQEIS